MTRILAPPGIFSVTNAASTILSHEFSVLPTWIFEPLEGPGHKLYVCGWSEGKVLPFHFSFPHFSMHPQTSTLNFSYITCLAEAKYDQVMVRLATQVTGFIVHVLSALTSLNFVSMATKDKQGLIVILTKNKSNQLGLGPPQTFHLKNSCCK